MVKSSPGLIGHWAELTTNNFYLHGIDDLVRSSPWLTKIVSPEHLKSNWAIIFKFLVEYVDRYHSYRLDGLMLTAQIGTPRPSPPEITPVCF